ncbi:MAG: hypothetical protein RIS47_1093 [Bacteroidota bacterium]
MFAIYRNSTQMLTTGTHLFFGIFHTMGARYHRAKQRRWRHNKGRRPFQHQPKCPDQNDRHRHPREPQVHVYERGTIRQRSSLIHPQTTHQRHPRNPHLRQTTLRQIRARIGIYLPTIRRVLQRHLSSQRIRIRQRVPTQHQVFQVLKQTLRTSKTPKTKHVDGVPRNRHTSQRLQTQQTVQKIRSPKPQNRFLSEQTSPKPHTPYKSNTVISNNEQTNSR